MKYLVLFVLCVLSNNFTFGQSDADLTQLDSSWGIGFDFGPCTGFGWVYGDANQSIDCGCVANVGMTTRIGRGYMAGRGAGMSGTLTRDLTYGLDWKESGFLDSFHFDLVWGYYLVHTKRINLIPMFTIGVNRFNTREEVGGDITQSRSNFAYSASTAFDVKFYERANKKRQDQHTNAVQMYWYIRFIGGVYPSYFKIIDVNGGLSYLNVSIGMFIQP